MANKMIPLSRLEMELRKILNECAASAETVVVALLDQRLLAIQSLESQELVAKPKASPRKPFGG